MQKYLIFVLQLILFFGCYSLEVTITEIEQLRQLNDSSIKISTNEKVDIHLSDIPQNNVQKYVFSDFPISKYKVVGDSIKIFANNFSSTIHLSEISKITSDGIFDKEIGFVSEAELIKQMDTTKSSLPSIMGAILGMGVGVAISISTIYLTNDLNVFGGTLFPFAIGGAIGGGIIGSNIYMDNKVDDALKKIKLKKRNTK